MTVKKLLDILIFSGEATCLVRGAVITIVMKEKSKRGLLSKGPLTFREDNGIYNRRTPKESAKQVLPTTITPEVRKKAQETQELWANVYRRIATEPSHSFEIPLGCTSRKGRLQICWAIQFLL